ncbi:hypothetical protein STENM327S_00154 [Streptomyces tendae]
MLRAGVRTVGTTQGAALMEVTTARFTRLARLGLLVPVTFYVNRYRAVVWLYLAEELRQFRADERNTALLKGRTPEGLRDRLGKTCVLATGGEGTWDSCSVRRTTRGPGPRRWRRCSTPPTSRTSSRIPTRALPSRRFRPVPATHGSPGSPAAQLAEEIATAADPDEVDWLRSDLAAALDTARRHRPAPGPARRAGPARSGIRAVRDGGTGAARGGDPRAARGGATRTVERPVRQALAQRRLTYRARKRPSCTTDTSMRPSLS